MANQAQMTVGGAESDVFNVTIANGASLSSVADLGTLRLFAIQMPTTWTSAGLTFQVSIDGTNYYNLYDDTGTEVSWIASASQVIQSSNPGRWLAFQYVKVRSGTSGTPVNQGGARTLTLVAVP